MKSKEKRVFRSRTAIPLCRAFFYLIVADDPCDAYAKTSKTYFSHPRPEETPKFHAKACYDVDGGSAFGIYLPTRQLDTNDIAHEVAHIIDYLIDYMGHECVPGDEFMPRISGFITSYIYQQLEKRGVKVAARLPGS